MLVAPDQMFATEIIGGQGLALQVGSGGPVEEDHLFPHSLEEGMCVHILRQNKKPRQHAGEPDTNEGMDSDALALGNFMRQQAVVQTPHLS
jgi:hypothetical protein